MRDLTEAKTLHVLSKQQDDHLDASTLVSEFGGRFSTQLGIQLDDLDAVEIYKWLLAALLYGAPISEKIATHTWQVLERKGLLMPGNIIRTGWDGLVNLLDEGGYARYDHKTATKMLAVSQALLDRYAGNLNHLHAAALDSDDLAQRIMGLSKGIGPVTVQIFLRELRGRWHKAMPPLAQLAHQAAQTLGFLPQGCDDDHQLALARLQDLWEKSGMSLLNFPDFEAALVRYGLWLRHQGNAIKNPK
ncbi:MAG: hypothetical protein U1D41_13830 [Nitrosomonas sp.]|uniref:hypothetical protein n=1 Tax=Nitrosomonas sp. TaxID=42353 RepID=UPI0027356683|nr:hypothetical protein [Nitrosomonas sp.]MDP3663800.1 hypothetical protein [Nitrosomonas sp.]MDZ4107209.1 hypothetical protein [Nitrosomonas sp.]